MDKLYKKVLQKQGYYFIGEHSAVKTCHWTKSSLTNESPCYKQKFYGIKSHRCAQMSPAVNFCNHDCVFCWRERNNSEFGVIDNPIEIAENIDTAQRSLLSGYGGNPNTNMQKFLEAQEIKHVAISLNGESTAYPRIGELIQELRKRGKSTFLVSNGTFPHILREMILKKQLPTQLYISIESPNKEVYKLIDRPIYEDTWDRLMETLDILREIKSKTRTVIRLTLVKGINICDAEGYARLIERADVTFLEVKGYSHLGASRERLESNNIPTHNEVRDFALEIGKYCGYRLIDEQEISRVVLLMKEEIPDRIINFED